MRKITSILVLLTFALSCITPPQGFAQSLTAMGLMSEPGTQVALSGAFAPAHLRGMEIDPKDPFKFDFIIYRGDEPLTEAQKQVEYTKLIKYFLASLAVPDKEQWVNLSPYEKDRIIPDNFGLTEMGRDLLAQDYLLKQISASLTNPDTDLGKKFWDGVYATAYEKFGSTDIPTDSFNKVWIVPDKAVVFEQGNTVVVLENHLKVMLESDYKAMNANDVETDTPEDAAAVTISKQVMREVIIPAIEKEVNEGKNFAPLRQITSGMLLATWYKVALKESILGKVYADSSKVKGVDQDPKNNQEIYTQYVAAFKKGVFNMIKEDVDRYSQEVIPRKYFSGGFQDEYAGNLKRDTNAAQKGAAEKAADLTDRARTELKNAKGNAGSAMTSSKEISKIAKSISTEISFRPESSPKSVIENYDKNLLWTKLASEAKSALEKEGLTLSLEEVRARLVKNYDLEFSKPIPGMHSATDPYPDYTINVTLADRAQAGEEFDSAMRTEVRDALMKAQDAWLTTKSSALAGEAFNGFYQRNLLSLVNNLRGDGFSADKWNQKTWEAFGAWANNMKYDDKYSKASFDDVVSAVTSNHPEANTETLKVLLSIDFMVGDIVRELVRNLPKDELEGYVSLLHSYGYFFPESARTKNPHDQLLAVEKNGALKDDGYVFEKDKKTDLLTDAARARYDARHEAPGKNSLVKLSLADFRLTSPDEIELALVFFRKNGKDIEAPMKNIDPIKDGTGISLRRVLSEEQFKDSRGSVNVFNGFVQSWPDLLNEAKEKFTEGTEAYAKQVKFLYGKQEPALAGVLLLINIPSLLGQALGASTPEERESFKDAMNRATNVVWRATNPWEEWGKNNLVRDAYDNIGKDQIQKDYRIWTAVLEEFRQRLARISPEERKKFSGRVVTLFEPFKDNLPVYENPAAFYERKKADGYDFVGVVTSSGLGIASHHRDRARNALREAWKDLDPLKTIIVCGATGNEEAGNLSGVELVYEVAEEMGFETMGIMSAKGFSFPMRKLHHLIVQGLDWGNESDLLYYFSDKMTAFTGGNQARNELSAYIEREKGKPGRGEVTLITGIESQKPNKQGSTVGSLDAPEMIEKINKDAHPGSRIIDGAEFDSAMSDHQRQQLDAAGIKVVSEQAGSMSLEIKLNEDEFSDMTGEKALEKFANVVGWSKDGMNVKPDTYKLTGNIATVDIYIDSAQKLLDEVRVFVKDDFNRPVTSGLRDNEGPRYAIAVEAAYKQFKDRLKEAGITSSEALTKAIAAANEFDKGGIDLNSANLDLQIKRNGNGVPLPISEQNLENIRIDGLVPVILNIRPTSSVPLFSEAATTAPSSA